MSKPAEPTSRLPLFPLHTVLYPGGTLPLRIFETRYVDLVRDCLRNGTGFGIVPIREGTEAGAPAIPYPIGTYVEIHDWSQGADGLLHIAVTASCRFRVHRTEILPNRLTVGDVQYMAPMTSQAATDEFAQLRALLDKLLEHRPPMFTPMDATSCDPVTLAYRVAELLPVPLALKTAWLELDDDVDLLTEVDLAVRRLITRTPSNG
jgi:Lon protease-like protein